MHARNVCVHLQTHKHETDIFIDLYFALIIIIYMYLLTLDIDFTLFVQTVIIFIVLDFVPSLEMFTFHLSNFSFQILFYTIVSDFVSDYVMSWCHLTTRNKLV